uniref:APH domain-containing protein n=1 Tax=Caenorhabditis tropicalis TaxID=1561998 RepID=A0A1I7V393_9PELO
MEKWTNEIFEDTVVFCHNDLTSANILELNSNDEIMLIDWEFASYNCRGYDLAMFLSETAIARGIVTAQINEKLTENHPNLRGFCEAYVDSDNKIRNRSNTRRRSQILTLIKEVEFFWPITHLFWACFLMKLSLIKYEGNVDLSIRGRDRFAVYFHLKPRSQRIYEELRGSELRGG